MLGEKQGWRPRLEKKKIKYWKREKKSKKKESGRLTQLTKF